MLGFPASALARLALGCAFVAATGVMVWAIERPRVRPRPPPVAGVAPAPGSAMPLGIESSYPVAQWTVQVRGVDLRPSRSDAASWSGTVRLAVDDEIFIQAVAQGGASAQAHHCLRLRLGSAPDRFIWGSGDVTATAGLPP